MTDKKPSIVWRLRGWLAGVLFLAAGRLHPTYDVWLDEAEPRHPDRLFP